ncbi:MAG TPA: type II toxin-antitoxin system RelE/ParE family toxin [Myxococcota bacterium]|nr:type II toxin-antitoxin system RelE/ParE family toxin [Myxococcota bacterium]HRY92867.1 type II toxin-antitoxin system RelE/ParE family toxin [Myxococcota bacterium]HSA20765.1 type II toxin-antitoxin system RelE/ParE family toxin [Myxococcota bacterium]
MASFEIEVSASAERQLRRLPRADQIRVARAILGLGREPFPRGFRKLSGYSDVFRVRVGTYRVLYSVDRGRVVIVVLKVGHRRDVYR